MNVLKDNKNTVRRIMQLRLEELAWSKIHEILDVDQETAKRYFNSGINNIHDFRAEKSQVKKILSSSLHISAFGIQYELGFFLAMQAIPYKINDWRKTKKGNDKLDSIKNKYQYTRCIQLYLEGIERDEISKLLSIKIDRVTELLANKEFYKTYGTVKPVTFKATSFGDVQTSISDIKQFGRHILYDRHLKSSSQEKMVFYSIQT